MDKARPNTRTWTSALAWTAIAGLALAARLPDWVRRPRLWAEDGNLFYANASGNWLGDVATPYAGYLHLLPRTIAWVARLADPALVPALFVSTSFAITLLVVARVFCDRLEMPMKPLMALAVVAAPGTGEVYLCPTNLQWIVALVFPLTLLMRDPRGRLEWAGDLVFLAGAGLTGPFSIFASPFFAVRALTRRTRASWVLAGVVAVAALVQAGEIFLHPRGPASPRAAFDALGLFDVLSGRIPLSLFVAHDWIHHAGRNLVTVLGAAGFCAIAAALLADDPYRLGKLQLAGFAIVLLASAQALVRLDTWDYRDSVSGDRYFYDVRVIVLWICASCLDRRPKALVVATITGAAALSAAGFVTPYFEGSEYVVRHVERPYFDWQPYAGPIRRGEQVSIQVSPGWTFLLRARLRPR